MKSTVLTAVALLALTSGASAHMKMANPLPRGNAEPPVGTPDYDLTTPLGGGRPFPCGGKPAGQTVLNVRAGSTIPVSVVGGANHGGGHCQFALSKDGNKFVVVKDVIRECLRTGPEKFDVTIPSSFPSGKAVFAWTWINAIGNREYYQNCADINIQNGGSGFTGPELFVANLPGFPTIPEMPASGTNDGRQFFGQRKQITIGSSGSGSNTGSTGGTPPTAPAPTKAPPRPAPQTPTKTQAPAPPSKPTVPPTKPSAPSTGNNAPLDRLCANGARMACSGNGFVYCKPGTTKALSGIMACAPGTKCQQSGAFIQCIFA